MHLSLQTIAALALVAISAPAVLAKTDITGCTSFTSTVTISNRTPMESYISVVWFVPDTLEICQGVDCGGGRAPPKSVPGCPLYKGTETVTARFLASDPFKTTTSSAPSTTTTGLTTTTGGSGSGSGSGTTGTITTPPTSSGTGAAQSGSTRQSTAAAPSAAAKILNAAVGVVAAAAVALV